MTRELLGEVHVGQMAPAALQFRLVESAGRHLGHDRDAQEFNATDCFLLPPALHPFILERDEQPVDQPRQPLGDRAWLRDAETLDFLEGKQGAADASHAFWDGQIILRAPGETMLDVAQDRRHRGGDVAFEKTPDGDRMHDHAARRVQRRPQPLRPLAFHARDTGTAPEMARQKRAEDPPPESPGPRRHEPIGLRNDDVLHAADRLPRPAARSRSGLVACGPPVLVHFGVPGSAELQLGIRASRGRAGARRSQGRRGINF
jgi:hypothetical protein